MPTPVCSNFISVALKTKLNNWPNGVHYVSLIVLLCGKKNPEEIYVMAAIKKLSGEKKGVSNHFDVLTILSFNPPTSHLKPLFTV